MGTPVSTKSHAMKPLGVLCIVLIWAGMCQAQPGQPFPPRGQGGFGGGGGNNFGGGGGGNFNRGGGGGFGGGPGGGFQQPAAVTTPSRAFVTPTRPQPQQQQPVFQQQQLPTQVGRGAGNSGNVFGGGGPGARGQDDRPQFQPRQQPQPIVTQPQPQPTITQPQPQPRAEPQPQPQPKAQPEPQPLPKAQPQPQPQPEAKAQPAQQQQQPSLAGNVRAVDGGRDGNNRNDRNDRNQQSGQQGTGGDNKQANQQPAAGQPQQPQGQQQTRAVDGQGDNRQGDNKQGDNKQGDNRQGDNKQGDNRQRERPDLNRVTGGTDQFRNKPQRDIDLQPEGETLRRNIQDNPRAAAESLATAYTSGRGDAAAKALTAAAASGAGATAAARAFAETSRVRPNAAPWLLRQSADYAVNYGLVGGWSRAFAQSFGWARQNNFLPSFVPAICNAILGGGFGTRYAFGSAFASAFAYDRPAFVEASAVAFCSGGSYAQAWAEASAVAIQQDPYTGCPVIREAYSTAYARCGPGFAQSWANTQSVSTVIGFCAAQVGGFWPGPFGK